MMTSDETIAVMSTTVILPLRPKRWWHWLLFGLQLCFIPLVIWWIPYRHLPPPGWAVAFIAVAAAIMSVHDEMKGWHKGLWLLIIGSFLITELRAIRCDRLEADRKAISAKHEADIAFGKILQAQDEDFKATITGLTTTVNGLNTNLSATRAVFNQTRPRAIISTAPYELTFPKGSSVPINLRISYTNVGDGEASSVNVLGVVYAADADQKKAAVQMAPRFEDAWRRKLAAEPPARFLSGKGDPLHRDFGQTGLSVDDLQKLQSHSEVLYMLFRVRYTDQTGTWVHDECRVMTTMSEHRDCHFFNNPRYKEPLLH